jgi:hypothetical protein
MANNSKTGNSNGAAQVLSTSDTDLPSPMYFPVSPVKLMVMSICTLSLYVFYWIYKNWRLIKLRERSNISPAGRTIFSVYYCYPLFSRIRNTASGNNINVALPAGPLAAGWIITALLVVLPDPYWLITYLATIFLLPVQFAANQVNEIVTPDHKRNEDFSAANIATIIIGGLFFVTGAIGTFFLPASAAV